MNYAGKGSRNILWRRAYLQLYKSQKILLNNLNLSSQVLFSVRFHLLSHLIFTLMFWGGPYSLIHKDGHYFLILLMMEMSFKEMK